MLGSRASRYCVAAIGIAAAAVAAAWNRPSRGEASQTVAIHFALVAKGRRVECGKPIEALGITRVSASLVDARFYVHDVRLLDVAGRAVPLRLTDSEWQHAGVTLLDFEDGKAGCVGDGATNAMVHGVVPKGTYVGLRFSVGVPDKGRRVDGATVALNHSNVETMPAPLDVLAMGWSWQAGRKYIKLEFKPEGGTRRQKSANASVWLLHLGATGCRGNPATGEAVSCDRPNRPSIEIERFDAATQEVAFDIVTLLAGSDLSNDGGEAVGCMASRTDPDCAPIFTRLGLTKGESSTGSTEPVFRATALR